MSAQIAGEVNDEQIEGTISLENSPDLSFTGKKVSSADSHQAPS